MTLRSIYSHHYVGTSAAPNLTFYIILINLLRDLIMNADAEEQ